GGLDIAGTIAAAGMARSIKLTGNIQQVAEAKSADLTFAIEGITPEAIKPYLSAFGIESELKDARFDGHARVDVAVDNSGNVTAGAKISGLRFTDGGDLLSMSDISIAGLGVNTKTGRVHVDSIEIAGPSVAV